MRRPDKYLSNGKRNERNTYLYSIYAFQFRKPVKAAHIKDALFYSIGFHYVGRGVRNNKEFFYWYDEGGEVNARKNITLSWYMTFHFKIKESVNILKKS